MERTLTETRLADPTATVLLATSAGRPIGSVLARADATFPGGELAALHVLPSSWGQGTGSRLHGAALALLAESEHETAWLWVISANNRGRRMYERRGWTLRGDVTQQYLGVPEVRYSRSLPRDRRPAHLPDIPGKETSAAPLDRILNEELPRYADALERLRRAK